MERFFNRRPTERTGLAIVACGAVLTLLLFVALNLYGATPQPLNSGYTFVSGEKNITHTKLNTMLSGATIGATFFTGQDAITTSTTSDGLLVIQSGAYGYGNLGDLIFSSANLISNRTEETAIASNDFLLVFDTSASAYRKARIDNALSNSLSRVGPIGNVVSNSGRFTSVSSTTFTNSGDTQLQDTLTVGGTASFVGTASFTDLAQFNGNMALGNAAGDTITVNGTLAGTIQGTPTVSLTTVTIDSAADKVLVRDDTDGKLKMALLPTLTSTKYTVTNALPANGLAVTNAHGLGAIPDIVRVSLICTNAEFGYLVGDEIDISHIATGAGIPYYVASFNSSNVVVVAISSTAPATVRKDTGVFDYLTSTNSWNLKTHCVKIP